MKLCDIDIKTYPFSEKAVLCFIKENDQLLLMHKKRGLGKGKINAPGGRIENGESAEEAAIRETMEEVCVTAGQLTQKAQLRFIFTDGYSLDVSVFFADSYTGKIEETDEAIPFWCPINKIPYEKMWEDDRLWLPIVLSGYSLQGNFIFDNDKMLDWELFPMDLK